MVVPEYLCIVFFMMQATSEEFQQAGLPTPMEVDAPKAEGYVQAGFMRCMDIYFFWNRSDILPKHEAMSICQQKVKPGNDITTQTVEPGEHRPTSGYAHPWFGA